MIEKVASIKSNYLKQFYFFNKAREGCKEYLRAQNISNDECVLLPAYIGWSANEGSGVFDPIKELELNFKLYKLNKSMEIDMDHLESCFKENKVKVFVIIHYFGFVDPNYLDVIKLARRFNVKILEDEAHSFFTNFVGGTSGRQGDASIFSLHKMFPLEKGGVLSINGSNSNLEPKNTASDVYFPFGYDFYFIAVKRVENSKFLQEKLNSYQDRISLIKTSLQVGEVPQTLPVIIKTVSRDKLYEKMNSKGYGVVSLYHTMIEHISEQEFPDSLYLAKNIMNLPVHQDISLDEINDFVEALLNSINELEIQSD